ncbi:MAG: hypothetical protein JW725_03870 [Candidatus Babeliaceae bacterium]|nr:hypothetical protein [Candidatus Babeliaceae bacterium]
MISKRYLMVASAAVGLIVLTGCNLFKGDQCTVCQPSAAASQAEAKPGAGDWLISIKKDGKDVVVFSREDWEAFIRELAAQQLQLNQLPQSQLSDYLNRMVEQDLAKMCAGIQKFYDNKWDKNPEYQKMFKMMVDNIVRGLAYRFYIENTFKEHMPTDEEAREIYKKEQTTMQELQRPPFVDVGVSARLVKVASEQEGKALAERAKKLGDLAKAAAEMKKAVKNLDFVSSTNYRQLGPDVDDMVASRILSMRSFPTVESVKGLKGNYVVVEGVAQKKSAYRPFDQIKEQAKEAIAASRLAKGIDELVKSYDMKINKAVIEETVKREGKAEAPAKS